MRKLLLLSLLLAAAAFPVRALADPALGQIETIVVIYAENRSFDNLYGYFPGANGLQNVAPEMALQRDRDGSLLKELPAVWGGVTAKGVEPAIGEDRTRHLPNRPFAIDDPRGFNLPVSVKTRDLWHLFYENQMQIDGGRNDKFAAWADSGGLTMGHYALAPSSLPLWRVAQRYTLADDYFMGAFGGSYLNHFWLACACTPTYPNADKSPARDKIAIVEADGKSLKVAAASPQSALDGPPKFERDGQITPDFYAVNTMQPPYQPSANKPPVGGDSRLADPNAPTTLPPQHLTTIGDLLSAKGIGWAWYAGAWQIALDGKNASPVPDFQYHHAPYNYMADMAPGTPARAEHLKDGGLGGVEFIKAIDAGSLPPVTFYKPQGSLNEHPGYADVLAGDEHIAELIRHLEKSKQWSHMVVIVTYDENGGFWDHVAPPKGDRWGPGSRVPLMVVSPFAKAGYVDHTQYDVTSILRLITRRFDLPPLAGFAMRDAALQANGYPSMGDLTAALRLP